MAYNDSPECYDMQNGSHCGKEVISLETAHFIDSCFRFHFNINKINNGG
jgi:hypothetical protein